MKKYKWNKSSIAVWNKEKFRENTAFEQRVKCDKEAEEYFAAKSYPNRMEELADFYIANAGLGYRFGRGSGKLICQLIEDSPWWNEVNKAIQAKMEINQTRTFVKKDGEWRHE